MGRRNLEGKTWVYIYSYANMARHDRHMGSEAMQQTLRERGSTLVGRMVLVCVRVRSRDAE